MNQFPSEASDNCDDVVAPPILFSFCGIYLDRDQCAYMHEILDAYVTARTGVKNIAVVSNHTLLNEGRLRVFVVGGGYVDFVIENARIVKWNVDPNTVFPTY